MLCGYGDRIFGQLKEINFHTPIKGIRMNSILKGHIYVAVHEVLELPHNDLYKPILVGASCLEPGQDLPDYYLRDDTGYHISEHNVCLSELTGLYWVWKNREDEWVGLVHYRRFFVRRAFDRFFPGSDKFKRLLTEDQVLALMEDYDLILPGKRHYLIETLYSHYSHTFDCRHLDTAREIIGELCPGYLPSFDRVMRMRSGHMFNMAIMKRSILDRYCSWLFPILLELERRETRREMDAYQRRFGGRIGERLLNVWLYDQIRSGQLEEERVCHLPVMRTDQVHRIRKLTAFLMARFFHRSYRRSW